MDINLRCKLFKNLPSHLYVTPDFNVFNSGIEAGLKHNEGEIQRLRVELLTVKYVRDSHKIRELEALNSILMETIQNLNNQVRKN